MINLYASFQCLTVAPLRNRLGKLLQFRMGAIIETDPQHTSGLLGGARHGATIDHADCHRLFTQHMFAGFERSHHLRAMQIGWARDPHRVEPGMGQQLFDVRIGAGHAVTLGKGLRALAGRAQHRHQFIATGAADGG